MKVSVKQMKRQATDLKKNSFKSQIQQRTCIQNIQELSAALDNSLAVFHRIKYEFTTWSSNSVLEYRAQRNKKLMLTRKKSGNESL